MNAVMLTISSLLIQFPLLLVWLVGIILSLFFWRQYPRASLFTLIAIALLFIEQIITTFLSMWLPLTLSNAGWGSGRLGMLLSMIGAGGSIIQAIAWGLLLGAIFGWRKER
jgi:hypothetical protein